MQYTTGHSRHSLNPMNRSQKDSLKPEMRSCTTENKLFFIQSSQLLELSAGWHCHRYICELLHESRQILEGPHAWNRCECVGDQDHLWIEEDPGLSTQYWLMMITGAPNLDSGKYPVKFMDPARIRKQPLDIFGFSKDPDRYFLSASNEVLTGPSPLHIDSNYHG